MKQKLSFRNFNGIVIALVVLGTLILSGCSSFCETKKVKLDSDFDSQGLPNPKYLVGGGYEIDWVASVDGTAYLVVSTPNEELYPTKLIMTKACKSGESFELSSDDISKDDIKKLYAHDLNMSALKFSLYFIPAVKTQANPATQ